MIAGMHERLQVAQWDFDSRLGFFEIVGRAALYARPLTMFASQAFGWARRRTLDALAAKLRTESRHTFADREQLSCRVDGRACRLTLWSTSAEVDLSLFKPVLPTGLRINESSSLGPQKYEAWSSGEAAKTGDVDFDAAFIVVGATSDTPQAANEAGRISPEVRSALLSQRNDIRDIEITPELVTLPIRASGLGSPAPHEKEAGDRIVWALGATLLGFNKMPSVRDLEEGILRAVQLAKALEAFAPSR